MWQAESKIGENEIAFELMGFNVSMVSANITTSNEEDLAVYKKLARETQGPGFMVILFGDSAEDFAFKKKVLEQIVSEADGQSLKYVENPEIEGILLAQCTRISASIRETFSPGGKFNSIPVMGQRHLTIKWAIGAGQAKLPLIEKGYIVDDGGAFFGWSVEQGHLGKTEIFCKYDPSRPEARAAVMEWQYSQVERALKEKYFALTLNTPDEVGLALCNYLKWWRQIRSAIDPNHVAAETGMDV
jgi:hypothetical protein